MKARFLLTLLPLLCADAVFAADDEEAAPVRFVGSSAAVAPVSLAVPILGKEGIQSKLYQEPSSTLAIQAVGEGLADIAICIRKLSGADRAKFPRKNFQEFVIGYQALAVVAPRDVWESGVHALTQDQFRAIYEGEIKNWKALGGEDRAVKFYNPTQGRGIWEFMASWTYGEIRKAPLGEGFEAATDTEETRNLVEFHDGSISVMAPAFADQKTVYALAVSVNNDPPVAPTTETIRSGAYPFMRPLVLVTGERPTGVIRKTIEFMQSPDGQALVRKSELTPIESH